MIKKYLINFSLLILSCIISLLILELILQQIYPPKSIGYPRGYFVSDEVMGYDIKKSSPKISFYNSDKVKFDIWSNKLGCFDDEYKNEKNYIMLMGDSFTWGYTEFEKKWGYLLEKNLNRRVLKCGVPGFGQKSELLKTQRIIKEIKNKPKVMVLGLFVGNDIIDAYRYPYRTVLEGYLVETNSINSDGSLKLKSIESLENEYKEKLDSFSLSSIKYYLFLHSVLYDKLKNLVVFKKIACSFGIVTSACLKDKQYSISDKIVYGFEEEMWMKDAWKKTYNDLIEIQNYSKELDSELIVVLIPTKEQVYEFLRNENSDVPIDRLKVFFEKQNFKYIDLLKEFQKNANQTPREQLDSITDLYYSIDGHWNANGNALAAKVISKYFKEHNILNK